MNWNSLTLVIWFAPQSPLSFSSIYLFVHIPINIVQKFTYILHVYSIYNIFCILYIGYISILMLYVKYNISYTLWIYMYTHTLFFLFPFFCLQHFLQSTFKTLKYNHTSLLVGLRIRQTWYSSHFNKKKMFQHSALTALARTCMSHNATLKEKLLHQSSLAHPWSEWINNKYQGTTVYIMTNFID